MTSSTRYVGGAAYTTAVTGFDDGYRPLGQSVTIPASETGLAGTYTTGYTYTANGAQATTSLPAVGNLPAETVTTVYDQVGMPRWLMGAGTYVADSLYSGFGEPLQYDLGNTYAATVSYSYAEGSRRLDRAWLWAEGTDGYAMDVAYAYDEAGNPTSAVDTAAGQPVNTACYSHDGLRRLASAWTPGNGDCATPVGSAALGGPAPYGFTDTFDQVGNRTGRTSYAPEGITTSTYTYDTNPAAGTPGPHALVGVSVTGPAGTSVGVYSYDAAGNTTTRDPADRSEQVLTWDVEGELVGVDGGDGVDASYVHTADGDRLVRREGDKTTVYLPGGQEITRNNTTGAVTGTRYYGFGGQTIAVRTQSGYAGVDSLVSDPQGTAQVAVDNATNEVTRRYFDPYGNPVGGDGDDWAGDHGFLNKPVDDTGLVAVGARYYDPGIGRFISVDPVMDLSDPGQWQGYAYANNNPVTYSDPTGLKPKKKAGGVSKGTGGSAPTAGPVSAHTTKTFKAQVASWRDRLAEVAVTLAEIKQATERADRDFWIETALNTVGPIAIYNNAMRWGSACTQGVTECALVAANAASPLAEPAAQTIVAAADGRWADAAYSARKIYLAVGMALTLGTVGGGARPTSTARAGNAAESAGAAEAEAPLIKAGSAGGESAGKVFPQSVREGALAENSGTCVYCRVETEVPQVDHAIPRARGGNATLENAQTTCPHCNASKGARDFPVTPPDGYEGPWPPQWWSR
jgi:RHS repeat-associated protein